MKKNIIICFSVIFLILLTVALTFAIVNSNYNKTYSNINSVKYNGWLHTEGSKLKNEKNEIIQLRGLSTHLLEFYGPLVNRDSLEYLKESWNINTIRVAMYTDCDNYGYIHNPEINKEYVTQIADWAIDLDMYVIMDWHIYNDNNPQKYEKQAQSFFDEMSSKYSNTPNIIYEICNEPNGNNVTWDNHVKPYAEKIIETIRKNSHKSLIIVGTPNWCTQPEKAMNNPLNYDNIIYSCHFYSGSHGKQLQDSIQKCIDNHFPIIISECGLTNATGNGKLYKENFNNWINFLNKNNISWINWSFSNKNESSALLKYIPVTNGETEAERNKKIEVTDDMLSEAGYFVKDILTSY